MINEIVADAKIRMGKAIEVFKSDLLKLRTGRAHPSLLSHISIDYYGTMTPLSQVASITVSDSRTLTVTPWEKTVVQAIEKAILNSNLGLNPATAGTVIRIPLPALTEERRKELVKVVKAEAENARISVRNVRRDANSDVKELLRAKDISEDDERRAQDRVQKLTDEFVAEIEKIATAKEAELMEV